MREQGLVSEAVYVNTFWVGNACVTEALLAEELKDYLVNLAYSGGTGLNLQKSLGWLAARKKEVLRQIPERELAACMEQLLRKDSLMEQRNRFADTVEANLRRQKELEGAIKVKKGMSEQVTAERKQAEWEERQRFCGERLLYTFCMIAVLFGGISFFMPLWQLKLAGWGICAVALLANLTVALPKIKRGKEAGLRKEALENQQKNMTEQIENFYGELTRLLPEIEDLITSTSNASLIMSTLSSRRL